MNNTVLPSQVKYFNIRLLALNKYILKETVHEIQISAERFYIIFSQKHHVELSLLLIFQTKIISFQNMLYFSFFFGGPLFFITSSTFTGLKKDMVDI